MATRTEPQEREVEVPADADYAAEQQALVIKRITVGIIPKVWPQLQSLMRSTRLNRTDVVNRAISVYAMVDEKTRNGCELVIRDPKTGKEHLVEIV